MRRKERLLQSSILTAALLVFAGHVLAAEPVPGGACTTLNYIVETGGPETSGIRHILRCNGTTWQQEMTIDASGNVGIGAASGGARLEVTGPAATSDLNVLNIHADVSYLGGMTLRLFNDSTTDHQTQINFQDLWYMGNDAIGDATTNNFYIFHNGNRPFTIGTDDIVSLNTGFALTGDITPAQITANQNDYWTFGIDTASALRLTSDASRNITSLQGGVDGRIITLVNVGTNPIVLKNDDGATGTAANRFALTADLTLAAKETATLMYDSTASRWRQIAKGSASGATAAGNNTEVQFNDGGGLAGNSGFTFDKTASALTVRA